MHEEPERADQQPVHAAPLRREAAEQRPADLADARGTREYRPMIAPRSAGNRSDMSASSPRAAGVAPASTKRPTAAAASADAGDDRSAGRSPWFTASRPTARIPPPTIP